MTVKEMITKLLDLETGSEVVLLSENHNSDLEAEIKIEMEGNWAYIKLKFTDEDLALLKKDPGGW